MVRSPSVDKNGLKRGAWSKEEDNKLRAYVLRYGHWNWRQLPRFAGLARCGKSCRLRWMNYLRPDLKRERFSKEEQEMIIKLHQKLGNKWSAIAAKLPGRTDNEIKNYWNSNLKKRMKQDSELTGKTNGRSQNMDVMDQKEQHFPVFFSDLSQFSDQKLDLDVVGVAADDTSDEISFSSYDYSNLLGDGENSLSSEESLAKLFGSLSTEPVFQTTSSNQTSSSTSNNSTVLSLEDWVTENGISLEDSLIKSFQDFSTEPVSSDASNGPISSSKSCNSIFTNSEESSTDAFPSFFTEPISSNASNGLTSPSTSCHTIVTNFEESSADALCSVWDEPIFSNASENIISPSRSCNSVVTNWEETSADALCSFWSEPIFSNASSSLISPSTSGNSAVTSSVEASADAFGDFWAEPFSLDPSYNQSIHHSPQVQEEILLPYTSFLDYGVDLFNQF